jgi:site-specific DNA-methyltransferase (adenine-specific)
MPNEPGRRSPRNRTLTLTPDEEPRLRERLFVPQPGERLTLAELENRVVNADLFSLLPALPQGFADLIIVDPPYNLDKDFHGNRFKAMPAAEYESYVDGWLPAVLSCAKPGASVYVCCDWKSSAAVYSSLARHAIVRNRITWQREKGRGAEHNWKNCSEDIWFATLSNDYYFDVSAVMHRKRVIAPYRENGEPKDWQETEEGRFRLTHPSNFWDDITVPYWSMSENTDHPTQKPEKLLAKLILASSAPGDLVFDPFAGSGSTAVAAKKLERRYTCVEQNDTYCLWAEKRLEQAETDQTIQGYTAGVFRERNT